LFITFPITPPPPPRSTLFPYTTLFRSAHHSRVVARRLHRLVVDGVDGEILACVDEDELRSRRVVERDLVHHRGSRRCVRSMPGRSEEHTSELQSRENLVCRLLLEKKNY